MSRDGTSYVFPGGQIICKKNEDSERSKKPVVDFLHFRGGD